MRINRFSFLSLCAVAALVSACSGSHSSNVNPAWTKNPNYLTVIIGEPSVLNKDDLEDDLPGNSSNFAEWVSRQIQMGVELRTNMKPEMRIEKEENYEIARLPVDQSTVSIHLPNPEKIKNLHGVVLTIHPIQFWRSEDDCGQHPFGCFFRRHLMAKGTYAYTDMDRQEVLGYGFFFVQNSFNFAMTSGNWEEAVKDIVAKVLDETPLQK
ncbi:MAG: hypothetical protein J6W22_03290 [Fibrobacter sp.]|nr:hypothetical protein [Fibrobacter sp.]